MSRLDLITDGLDTETIRDAVAWRLPEATVSLGSRSPWGWGIELQRVTTVAECDTLLADLAAMRLVGPYANDEQLTRLATLPRARVYMPTSTMVWVDCEGVVDINNRYRLEPWLTIGNGPPTASFGVTLSDKLDKDGLGRWLRMMANLLKFRLDPDDRATRIVVGGPLY